MPAARRLTAALAFACLTLGPAGAARAQYDPGKPVPGVHQAGLLTIPAVQRELKLEPYQIREASALAARIQDKLKEGSKPLPTEELADRLRKLRELHRNLDAEAKKAIAAILDEARLRRLRQISIRDRAGMAFVDPEVQDALKMNDRQRARVESFVCEGLESIRAMVDGGHVSQREAVVRAQAIRKAIGAKLVGELDPDRKSTWDALIGDPFEINYADVP